MESFREVSLIKNVEVKFAKAYPWMYTEPVESA